MWRAERAVTLRVASITRLGIDERRASQATATNLRERIYGNRTLRIQMIVDTNDQDLLDSAQEQADLILAGFMRSDVETLLMRSDLGVPVAGPVLVTNAPDAHGDERSIAIVDLVFPWSRCLTGGLVPLLDAVEIGTQPALELPQSLPVSFDSGFIVPPFTVSRD